MSPSYVLGYLKHWETCPFFKFPWELGNMDITIWISFRWRNQWVVRQFFQSRTTRRWRNESSCFQSSWLLSFYTSHFDMQTLLYPVLSAPPKAVFQMLITPRGSWFPYGGHTAQEGVCTQSALPGGSCSLPGGPSWKVEVSACPVPADGAVLACCSWEGDKGISLASLKTYRCFLRSWEPIWA